MAESKLIAKHFERLEEIGAGAMGTVYLGRDTFDDSKVAIKELKPEVIKEDPELVERFAREGEALRKLNHPSIVKVLASAEEDGNHYIVMEYVDGGSLRDLLNKKEQLPINQVLEIALDLSDALARAHRLNIIHRDIKPANVLIASDGTPRLTDFGIARIGDSSQMTQTGVIMGTLAYLPPEALSGIRIDHRADIWAFGVMLYEMCAGHRPFEAESTGGLLAGILQGSVPDLLQHRPYEDFGSWGLPGLIYWMLEKERADRPNSARLVGAMVENLLSGQELPSWNWFGDQTGSYDGSKEYESDTNIQLSPEQAAKAAREFTTGGFRLDELKADTQTSPSEISLSVNAENRQADPIISRSDWSISLKRSIDHKPRIFISYRRQDSTAITGRLYDRLVMAFGAENIFKDVDNIPPGADFKQVLEQQVTACDVALIMIGQKWINAANEQGRRLEDSSDFVRIEVEAALGMSNKLVVPVLVDDAEMPEERLLPPTMKNLLYRNAAQVRNDPDFNRDAEWLIKQIHNAFEYTQNIRKIAWRIPAIVASLLIAIAIIYGLWGILNPSPLLCDVAVVGQDETMILIAHPERIAGEERDVQGFIFEDLRGHFEQTIPFSPIRIRASKQLIRNEEDALALANLCHAGVIIWGHYDAERSFMNVQFGDPEDFPLFVFEESVVRAMSDAEYIMRDEQTETLAFGVIAALNITWTVANDSFNIAMNLTIGELVGDTPAQVQGSTEAARYHRHLPLYIFDPEQGIEELNLAIDTTGGNALLYLTRSLSQMRLGNLPEAREDIATAQSLGPKNWIMPQNMQVNDFVYFRNDFESAIPLLDEIIEQRPDDWFFRTYRGNLLYQTGKQEAARSDLEAALTTNPITNWPYPVSIIFAMRDADFLYAQELYAEAQNFRNAAFIERLLLVTFNEDAVKSPLVPFLRGFTNLTLERWPSLLNDMDEALTSGLDIPEIHFMRGFAYCNQKEYALAEEAYTQAIALDPDFIFLYFLRAEVRFRQGGLKMAGVVQDLASINSSGQAKLYEPFTSRGVELMNEVSCENFLELDLSKFGIAANTVGSDS
jgi:serine/threonine protein kinase/tetratricopeptide (TPR) repeat protein